jgi:thiol-disulfide isomerase/thioredoxin
MGPGSPGSRWRRPLVGPFTVRHVIAFASVLVAAAVVLAVLSTPIAAPARPLDEVPGSGFYQLSEPTEGLAVGQLAPELEGIVGNERVGLRSLDGELISLEALRGRPVWLSFFATWCPPCQEEMPVLREAHGRYAGRGLAMVAVSVQQTTAEDVAAYAETYSLPYAIGFDATSAVFKTYAGFGLPTHVFIDDDGVIRDLRYGPLDLEQVGELVEPLLASSP